MKKGDIIIISVIIILIISIYSFIYFNDRDMKTLYIKYFDEEYEYKLSSSFSKKIELEKGDKKNIIEIKDNKVFLSYSSCKNQHCVKTGEISKVGEKIICIPNHLFIQIKASDEDIEAISF